MATKELKILITANAQKAIRAFKRFGSVAKNTISRVNQSIKRIAFRGAIAGAVGLAAAFKLIQSSVKAAFRFESLETQLAVLLGSAKDAKKQFSALQKFSGKTPFQLGDIIDANKHLIVFTNGLAAGEKEMNLVGDAAAGLNQNIQDVAFWFGRAYSAIQGGLPFGEASMRLMEMGILGPAARKTLEGMAKEGKPAAEILAVLTKEFEKFEGGMVKLSTTGDGLISTLKDNWTNALGTFGKGFSVIAKKNIAGFIKKLQELAADGSIARFGQITANVFSNIAKAGQNAFKLIANYWVATDMNGRIKSFAEASIGAFNLVTDSKVWTSFGDLVMSTIDDIKAGFLKLPDAIDVVIKSINWMTFELRRFGAALLVLGTKSPLEALKILAAPGSTDIFKGFMDEVRQVEKALDLAGVVRKSMREAAKEKDKARRKEKIDAIKAAYEQAKAEGKASLDGLIAGLTKGIKPITPSDLIDTSEWFVPPPKSKVGIEDKKEEEKEEEKEEKKEKKEGFERGLSIGDLWGKRRTKTKVNRLGTRNGGGFRTTDDMVRHGFGSASRSSRMKKMDQKNSLLSSQYGLPKMQSGFAGMLMDKDSVQSRRLKSIADTNIIIAKNSKGIQ